jgi:hypothetical protein
MTEGTTRAELARWFIDHDDIDEAARILVPGDALELGPSDYQDLAAALARRGLAATRDDDLVQVIEGNSLGATPRKPPARTTPVPASAKKQTA